MVEELSKAQKNLARLVRERGGYIAETNFLSLEVPTEHIAMRDLDSQNRNLHFSGKPSNLNDLVVELLILSETVTRGMESATATAYFWGDGGVAGLIALLQSGFGVVAVGPQELLQQYAAILEKHNLRTSVFGAVDTRMNNEEERYSGYQMLLWDRSSYVIADEFNFFREA